MRRSKGRALLNGVLVAVIASVSLMTVACGNDTPNTPTTPTPPTPVTITETFSGTLTVNGAVTHSFLATAAGTVTVQATAIDPSSSQVFGLLLGLWNGSS